MSLRSLKFKHWAMIVIVTIWFLSNLSFSPQKEGTPYFKIYDIESVGEEIASAKAKKVDERERQRRRFFWNSSKKAFTKTEPVVVPVKKYAPEETVLGFIPKESYTFLQKVSPRNCLEVWKGIANGTYDEAEQLPDNYYWGLWTPAAVLVLLILCVLLKGNIFRRLRPKLKELPEVDEAPDEEEYEDEEDGEDEDDNEEDEDIEETDEEEN